MPTKSKATNPFFIVLLVVGVAFVLTATCYFVMTVQGRDLSLGRNEAGGNQQFVQFVDRYGFAALMIELGILAVATCAAIGTDEYWTKRGQSGSDSCDSEAITSADNETADEVSS